MAKPSIRLYDTNRKTQVAIKPTVSFLQDLNVLMSHYGIDASEVIRGSVSAQADWVRQSWHESAQRLDRKGETSNLQSETQPGER